MLLIRYKMQQTHIENIREVLRNKARIQKELNIKLSNKGHNIFIDGKAKDEYLCLEVLEAVNLGFSVDHALELKREGMMLQTVHIKGLTKRNDLERVRGRIIGKGGRTLKTLQKLTQCDLSINDNEIGIIGNAEEIEDAIQSITSLVQGSKQGNVYGRLERQRKKKRLDDDDL